MVGTFSWIKEWLGKHGVRWVWLRSEPLRKGRLVRGWVPSGHSGPTQSVETRVLIYINEIFAHRAHNMHFVGGRSTTHRHFRHHITRLATRRTGPPGRSIHLGR